MFIFSLGDSEKLNVRHAAAPDLKSLPFQNTDGACDSAEGQGLQKGKIIRWRATQKEKE